MTQTFSFSKVLTIAGVVVLSSLVLAACLPTSSTSSTAPSASATPVASAAPLKLLMTDLDDACMGAGVSGTTAYDASKTEINAVVALYQTKDSDLWYEKSTAFPDSWTKKFDKASEIELVACVSPKNRTKVKDCTFEDKEDKTKKYTLELHDTEYDVKLVEASTGKEVAATTLNAKANKTCPIISSFSDDETTKIQDAPFDTELTKFVKPFVQATN